MKKARFALSALAFAVVCSTTALADLPPGAPAGSTGLCNDGTYTNTPTKSGACRGHQGVKTWFAAAVAKPAAAAPAAAPAPAAKPGLFSKLTSKSTTTTPAPAPAPAAKGTPPPPPPPPPASSTPAPTSPGKSTPPTKGMPTTAAAGGGPGMVWVNSSTKVYHCPTDRYYGKTKSGKYLSESAAQAEGDKPDAGKKCF